MKSLLHRSRRIRTAAAAAFLVLPAALLALEPTAWKNRQPLQVDRGGLVKLALPPETLGLARSGLEDLRLLDPAGREVPYAFTTPAPAVPAELRAPAGFQTALLGSSTQILIDTGTSAALDALTLLTPVPYFLKAARLEASANGDRWETLTANTAIFRQFGATQLRFELAGRTAPRLRITIDDSRTRPVAFTGARLQLAGSGPAAEISTPIAARLVRRDEYTGETVLTLDLGGANVPLASVEFATSEPLFARSVTFAVRELRDEGSVERTLGAGTIWRVAAEGTPPSVRLDVPVNFVAPSRELLVHIANGDSPPLALDGAAARQFPRWLVFHAAAPGVYAVLTGNPQAEAPRYDLVSLAPALRDTPPGNLVPGPAALNPGYRAPAALADTPVQGAVLDPAPWAFRKPVHVSAAGVQQLELDLEVLARARNGLGDLRLLRDGAQVPYLLERPPLFRSTALVMTPVPEPKRPRVSRWQIKFPRPGLPLVRLVFTSDTPLFQRQLRLVETSSDARKGETTERTLATGDWSHLPGEAPPLTLQLRDPPVTDTVFLETDNGDNPPISITVVQGVYPVARLLFKTVPGPLALYYDNRKAEAPRYDLALVARQIIAAEKSAASLGPEEQLRRDSWFTRAIGGTPAGAAFWGALVIVVVGLLFLVAKLLPKPPAPTS